VFFLSRAFWLICGSAFQAIAHDYVHNVFMALPPYTSTREGEARQLGVAPNPARVGLAVRKYPHSTFSVYLLSKTPEKGEAIALHTGEEHLAQALLVSAPRSEAS